LGIVALVSLVLFFVSFIIAAVLAIPIFGVESFTSMIGSSIQISDKNIPFLKYMQMVQSVGLFIIPSLFIAYLFGPSVSEYLRLKKTPYLRSILFAVLIILVSNPIINLTGEINSKLTLPGFLSGLENWMKASEEAAAQLTKLFLKMDSFGGLLFNLILIALIPAIGEEFLFRGIIQRIFKEWTKNNHWAIWISAVLFSALHFQFYGFVPRVILGAMFGYLFVISGNLWLPVITHFVNNAAAVIAFYYYDQGVLKVDPEEIGINTQYQFAAIVSLAFTIFLFYAFKKFEDSKNQKLRLD